jgi:colanic acid biosynthesis glycosyl transferase WcaI
MKILILGLNYAPEKVGIAVYTTGLANALAAAGHEVTIIAGQPYYPAWKLMDGHRLTWDSRTENGVTVIRCPHYIPANPTGIGRILHHISFALSTLFPALGHSLRGRPDLVFAVAPSIIGAPVARLAALVGGARSWLHVQDFEMDAAFATGLMNDAGIGARLAAWYERFVLKSFDRVSTISQQMCARLAQKQVNPARIVEFRNWGEMDRITPLATPSPFRQHWNITTPHVALYSGNIANKQGIGIVVEAAQLLRDRRDLTFVICGEGPNRAKLQEAAHGLDNIQFHDLQPKEAMNDMLSLASVHLLPQMAGAADLVLPSKLINMLASGRPVVATAAAGTGLAHEVEGCGIVTEPGDAKAFADAIARLLDDPALAASTSAAARHRAEERWSEERILGGVMRDFASLANTASAALEAGTSAK